jgi:transposase
MNMNQLTKITLAWELAESGVAKSHIAEQLGVNRDTVYEWIKGVNQVGLLEFLEQYINAKKGLRAKRKVNVWLKNKIYQLREENRDCCGQKIKEYLLDEYGVSLGVKAIYKILGEKYKLRSKWKKNQKRGNVLDAVKPREVIQMDSVHFGSIFAFTGIDIFTKEVSVKLYQSLTAKDGLDFLRYSFSSRFNHVHLLQTDGGSEFKAEFRSNVFNFAERFRVSRPYKKNEQSYIESFNRSLRKECLGWSNYTLKDLPDLEKELTEYLEYYHTKRVHIGLGMKTPNQFLIEVSDF